MQVFLTPRVVSDFEAKLFTKIEHTILSFTWHTYSIFICRVSLTYSSRPHTPKRPKNPSDPAIKPSGSWPNLRWHKATGYDRNRTCPREEGPYTEVLRVPRLVQKIRNQSHPTIQRLFGALRAAAGPISIQVGSCVTNENVLLGNPLLGLYRGCRRRK